MADKRGLSDPKLTEKADQIVGTMSTPAQCEGLENAFPDPELLAERQRIAKAEALIRSTGADFRIGGERPFYAPGPDFIQVPPQPAFLEQINDCRTCFLELLWIAYEPTSATALKSSP